MIKTEYLKNTITIFASILIVVLLISGFTFNYVIVTTKNTTNDERYYLRKEELLDEQKRLQTIIEELNKSIQNYQQKQNLLLDKLSATKSASEIAAEKELLAQKAKQVSLDTTIPEVVKPVIVTPKPSNPSPAPTRTTRTS